MEYLNEWILLMILTCTNGYVRKCPHPSQWNISSKTLGCPDQKVYICLLDGLKSYGTKIVFKEICGHGESSREGNKYILTPNLYQVPCAKSQYQPFTFTTDGNSQCVFSKSLCKASGQILANNGSSITDISCRCDYRKNYDYVIPPKDPCSCKPAEEDCSCYIRKCDDDKVMIADYRCMKRVETILPEDIKCPIINRIITPAETDKVDIKIQLQSVVTGSGTWSMLPSVLIVVVIIFTVLIGFLFFSVPHVTSIFLTSQFKLLGKRKENELMILYGDNVKIECNVQSYFPVRSVTWQKEKDGEIKQITFSMEKYVMVSGKRPSLTIDNFNENDQGKYRCIVRNSIGLRNELFGSCRNLMSRVGWLTGFHTGDITLHTDDIDPQSKPTVYNVYKGHDITMEQCCDDQQKLKTVKWFKESDKRTELDLSNEHYSGGVPNNPSLTIKKTRLETAGKYVCWLIYDNGEKKTALFKLKIIPPVNIYKALLEHREDETFIRPEICDTIEKHLQENNIVVINGREGTGKSKICLELASFYDEKDDMVVKVDLSEKNTIYTMYTDMFNALIIIDDQQYTQDSLNAFMKHLSPVLLKRNIKVILTCRNLDLEIVRSVPEIISLKGEPFIDINSCLTAGEKEKILRRYMEELNNATSVSNASNFRDPEIITNLPVPVTTFIDDDAIKDISNEEPWKGFPLSASLFCSERENLHLGRTYFTDPPRYLFEELKELYKTAIKKSNSMDTVNEYCILVYILNNKNHQLDLNDPDLCRKLVELYLSIFQLKYTTEKLGSNEEQKMSIEKAAHRMRNKYLILYKGIYKFIHPCLLKAMFLSSDYMVPYLLQYGSLRDITQFVRSNTYSGSEKELFIRIGEVNSNTFSERLVKLAFENKLALQLFAQYVYKHWYSPESNIELVKHIFYHIENTLFKNLEEHSGNLSEIDNDSFHKDSSTKVAYQITFSKVIVLIDELTCSGRDPWIYEASTADFLILSGFVASTMGMMGRYPTNKNQAFKALLREISAIRRKSESFKKLWNKCLDINGNTFFHYLMLFNDDVACDVLHFYEITNFVFNTDNVKTYTPLDIAAYLGKLNILSVLGLKTRKLQNELRDRLKRLAESGKAEFYKNTNIALQLDLKTNFYSVSQEKLQYYEDADKNRKEKGESKKNKSLSKRKEEPKKKDKHDKRDVLCFEDFIIDMVVYGKIEDYESIKELLKSK